MRRFIAFAFFSLFAFHTVIASTISANPVEISNTCRIHVNESSGQTTMYYQHIYVRKKADNNNLYVRIITPLDYKEKNYGPISQYYSYGEINIEEFLSHLNKDNNQLRLEFFDNDNRRRPFFTHELTFHFEDDEHKQGKITSNNNGNENAIAKNCYEYREPSSDFYSDKSGKPSFIEHFVSAYTINIEAN